MVLRNITLYPVRIRLTKPFVISLGPLSHAENVFVRIEAEDGGVGWGECSPFRTIHGETMETCMVVGREIARKLLDEQPATPELLLSLMDRIIYGNGSIKSAFDIAFHDLLARSAGMPLFRYLGGNTIRPLQTDYTVSLGPVEEMVLDAEEIISKGYRIIKVKLGGLPEDDVLRIKRIREVAGAEVPIRIDANQGWSLDVAARVLAGMSGYGIQHCEEPLPRHAYDSLPALRKSSPIPIMADESCCTEYDAARLIGLGACDGLNIKLGKSSGLVRAGRIATIGREHGLTLQAGGFLESRMGFTATAHLVLAHPEIQHVDFDTPLMFAEDPIEGGLRYGTNGSIELDEAPGIGATLKEAFAVNGVTCLR